MKDLLSVLRWAQNPRSRLAGFRVAHADAGPGAGLGAAPARRDGRGGRPGAGDARLQAAGRRGAATGAPGCRPTRRWRPAPGPTTSPRPRAGTSRTWSACTTTPRSAPADLAQLARIAQGFSSRERFLAELTLDPPEATSDESGAPHRDEDYLILSTMHSAKGQEWNAVLRAQRGRRLHAVRHGHRQRGRDRGGAAPALRGDDARQAPPGAAGAAALPRHAAGPVRRPAPVRLADAFRAAAGRGLVRQRGAERRTRLRAALRMAGPAIDIRAQVRRLF